MIKNPGGILHLKLLLGANETLDQRFYLLLVLKSMNEQESIVAPAQARKQVMLLLDLVLTEEFYRYVPGYLLSSKISTSFVLM